MSAGAMNREEDRMPDNADIRTTEERAAYLLREAYRIIFKMDGDLAEISLDHPMRGTTRSWLEHYDDFQEGLALRAKDKQQPCPNLYDNLSVAVGLLRAQHSQLVILDDVIRDAERALHPEFAKLADAKEKP